MTERVQPTSKFVTVNGLNVHYLEWGKPEMPAVVCVHGYTSSAQAFNALARHLQDRFHVIAMDVRGHGESSWVPTGAYEYVDQASDLAGFVDRLELSRFALIGTSMGGITAMTYVADHADRLNALVINDIGPDAEAGSNRITRLVGARPASFVIASFGFHQLRGYAEPVPALAHGTFEDVADAEFTANLLKDQRLGLCR